MGPLKFAGLAAGVLMFLWGLIPPDRPWWIAIGLVAFAACWFAPDNL